MNAFDTALIVAALGVAALTFTQPPITVIADILAVYAASVLAGILYRRLQRNSPGAALRLATWQAAMEQIGRLKRTQIARSDRKSLLPLHVQLEE